MTVISDPVEASVSDGKLRTKYLSFIEVLSHSMGIMGPSGTVIIVIPLVFATAGNGTWLAFAIALAAYLLVAAQINVFTRRIATPGSLYTYVGQVCGSLAAAITGWSLLIGYMLFVPVNIAAVSYYILLFIRELTGVGSDQDILAPLLIMSVAVLGTAWWLAHRDIRLSTRTTLFLEFITISLILCIFGGYFWHHGVTLDYAQLTLEGVTAGQFRLGLVLTMATFTGFEAAAVLGVEARLPFSMIPRAVTLTIVIVGAIILFSTYALVQAFHGIDPGLDKDDAPMSTLARLIGLGFINPFILSGVALSWFGCLLGTLNTAGRLLYALSHHGLFHRSIQRTHHYHATPYIAIGLAAITGLLVALGMTLGGIGAMDIVAYLATPAMFAFVFAYIMVSIAAPLYLYRQGTGHLKAWHLISAGLAVLLMGATLIANLYPVPDWPYNILPLVFLIPLALGVSYFLYVKKTNPGRLRAVESDLLETRIGQA